MKTQHSIIYYRLIALWVLCEVMLGGVIHGLRIPVSGLFVGSAAVICISLIAWYVPHRSAILKATIVVAIFKMMLSPQASFPAYIAVFFQGALGEVLFRGRKNYRLACFILGIAALIESGLQRILVLTIVYGNDLWVVINDFVNGLAKQEKRTNYSLLIGSAYLLLHLIMGMVTGWFAAKLPGKLKKLRSKKDRILTPRELEIKSEPSGSQKRKIRKIGMFVIWILLLGLYFQSELPIGKPLLPPDLPVRIFLRSALIILGWILIISPLLNQLLHTWLGKKQVKWKSEIAAVSSILPSVMTLIRASWLRTSGKKGIARLREFVGILLVNVLGEKNNVYIVSAPVQTGKTSRLLAWIRSGQRVAGILTPVKNGERYFMDIATGREFPMEASDNEKAVYTIGRFRFSRDGFSKAIAVLERDKNAEGWLVIDEIGPLELKGEGFAKILEQLLEEREGDILLVVREGLVDDVVKKFGINPDHPSLPETIKLPGDDEKSS